MTKQKQRKKSLDDPRDFSIVELTRNQSSSPMGLYFGTNAFMMHQPMR